MAKKPTKKAGKPPEQPAKRGRGRPPSDPVAKAIRKREADVARSRARTASQSEIGEIPPPANPERRAACANNLALFLQEYFPYSTGLTPFSDDHREVIAIMQGLILGEGRHVNAVYRGFAKSTISENSVTWAACYGHRAFPAIFAAEADLANGALESVKYELAENDRLAEDFPEICIPVRALEGKVQRCASQTHNGELTHIGWRKDRIVFPTIAGSKASGAVIAAKGLTSSILGLRHKTPDGRQLRPDLVVVDDPQTRESANHPQQVKKRLDILVRSILQMSGHRRKIAAIVNGTVIAENDAIDQLLNPTLFPSFQGRRIPMVKKWADRHEDLWLGRYRDLRRSFSRDDADELLQARNACNDLYRNNRAEMDAGCVVSWESCFDADSELSAIQHAYNLLIDDGPEAFASEYQQAPLREADEDIALSPSKLRAQVVNVPKWVVPAGCTTVTAFCDLQESSLWWVVSAWGEGLRGHVMAYGIYPEQPRSYITLREIKKTLAKVAGNCSLEAAVDAGLRAVAADLLGREYPREDGAGSLRCSALVFDANYAKLANVVRDFARRSQWGPVVIPSHGQFVGATVRSLNDRRPERGERAGPNWRTTTRERLRHLLYDTNAWKTLLASRLKLPPADPAAVTVHHADSHDMLFDHWSSEYAKRAASREKTVEEWRLHPGRDNHWWDAAVGAMVAASYVGVAGVGAQPPKKQGRTWSPEAIAKRKKELEAMAARAAR